MGISGNGKHLEGAEDIATPASRPCISIRTSTAICFVYEQKPQGRKGFSVKSAAETSRCFC